MDNSHVDSLGVCVCNNGYVPDVINNGVTAKLQCICDKTSGWN